MKFTFFCLEYANIRNRSVCRVDLLSREAEDGIERAVSRSFLVDPEDRFDENLIRVHGLTEEAVRGAPSFGALWKELRPYFEDAIVVGHNVEAGGLDAICHNLSRYGLEVPRLYCICTYRLARELIPSFAVEDYSMRSLCSFFNLTVGQSEGGLQKAAACSALLDQLLSFPLVTPESRVEPYVPHGTEELLDYVSNASVKGAIHSFYGMILGISLDRAVSDEEKERIRGWKEIFAPYTFATDVKDIVSVIDAILADNVITEEELDLLKRSVRRYLDVVSLSPATLATQILWGIVRGMLTDDRVTEEECRALRGWLYENGYLVNHPPFDGLCRQIESVLADGILTHGEALRIRAEIEGILRPIEALRKDLHSVSGKRVCLSGDLSAGQRLAIEAHVKANGGIVQKTVQSTTDMLVVGSVNSARYTEEIKQAMALNQRGGSIQISKDCSVLEEPRAFGDVLFDFIDQKGWSDAEVYKRAHLPRQTMSKIKCVSGYLPSKQNICAFAVALELTLEQTNQLLAAAGYVLSPNFAFDRVITDAILRGEYDVFVINERLYKQGIKWVDTQ